MSKFFIAVFTLFLVVNASMAQEGQEVSRMDSLRKALEIEFQDSLKRSEEIKLKKQIKQQYQDSVKRSNAAATKSIQIKNMRQELKDSIARAQVNDIRKTTNNEGYERGTISLDYEIEELVISSKEMAMSKGNQMAITLKIPDAIADDVKKEWSNVVKNKTKSKVEVIGGESVIFDTFLNEISDDALNVYAVITGNTYGTNVIAWFAADGKFINRENNKPAFEGAEKFLRKFGVEQYKNAVKDQIKEEDKVLKDLQNELEKLQKTNVKLHKKISDNELDIVNTQGDIKMNEMDQINKVEELSNQKRIVSQRSGDARKEAQKVLKEMGSDRKKLQKKDKNMHKKVVDYRAEIEKTRNDISINLTEQDLQKEKVNKQLSTVKSLEEKRSKIE